MPIPTTKVVFTGRLRAGKDHIAKLLGLTPLGVADPLYIACERLLGSCNKEIPQHRRLLQLLGAWGRGVATPTEANLPTQEFVTNLFQNQPDQILDEAHLALPISWTNFGKTPDFWIQVAKTKSLFLLQQNPEVKICIPNARFANEVSAFQQLGFLHLHVTCSPQTRLSRPGAKLTPEADNDITEAYAKELDETLLGPCVIWNDPNQPVPPNKGFLTPDQIL
jgi:hypothetical protein